jgi:hypothetical protein
MAKRKSVRRPDHPLATGAEGRVRVARLVLYEKMDGRGGPCHWCGKRLVWRKSKSGADTLCVDHLDGDETNDQADNLVPSCRFDNAMRSRERQGIIQMKPCAECGVDFKPIRKERKYCSRLCSNRATIGARTAARSCF